jgi:hypothetical protein
MKYMIGPEMFSKVFAGFVQSAMADPAQVVFPVWVAGEAVALSATTGPLLIACCLTCEQCTMQLIPKPVMIFME